MQAMFLTRLDCITKAYCVKMTLLDLCNWPALPFRVYFEKMGMSCPIVGVEAALPKPFILCP